MRTIEELVEEAKNGNKKGFENLILYVKNDLYKVARKRIKNEEDVQDVVQSTIVKAYIGLKKLNKNKYFKTWITKILINECNAVYRESKKELKIIQKYNKYEQKEEHIEDVIEFDNMIQILDEKEKKIFELKYKEDMSIKQISQKLNINENTIKYILSSGREKIKRTMKPATIVIIILCIFITGSIAAVSVIYYLKNAFMVKNSSMQNDGILNAIENMEWYQQVDMDYIDLGEGYKTKIEYLLLDEMNLYLIVDFKSEKDISKYKDLYFFDIKITNENGEVICNEKDLMSESYSKGINVKTIENDKKHIKTLMYMYTNTFPKSKSLNISFSEIALYKKSILKKNEGINIKSDVNFKIDLDEKFINRKTTLYTSNNKKIEKAVVTETGFYAIINETNTVPNDMKLIDEARKHIQMLYDIYDGR